MKDNESIGSACNHTQKTKKSEPNPGTLPSTPTPDKIPGEMKSTIAKVDEAIVRISKLIQTNAGLAASLATLNFSVNLAAYLYARSPTCADMIAHMSRILGRAPSTAVLTMLRKAPSITFLTPIGSLIADWRKTLRLIGLIPLYLRLRTLISKETSSEMDPILHRIVLLQCGAYIVFQAIENTNHLHSKRIIPSSIIEKRGGVAKWIAWCCRAWCMGVLCEFLRLWREASIEKKRRSKTAQEKEDYNRKWWNDFTAATCWLPVAVHSSFYPEGIRGMNAGTVALLSLVAGLNNFIKQWRATA